VCVDEGIAGFYLEVVGYVRVVGLLTGQQLLVEILADDEQYFGGNL
jgi:hypothetical protein